MLANVQARLQRWATGRNVLIFLVLFLVFEIAVLPLAAGKLQELSAAPNGGPLDLSGGLSPADTYARLTAYGPHGRPFYLIIELTVDGLFPITYGLFFSLTLALIFQRAFAAGSGMHRWIMVPLLGMLSDFVENIGIVTMLLAYPTEVGAAAVLTRIMTLVKWGCTLASVVLIIIGVVALVRQRRAARPGPTSA